MMSMKYFRIYSNNRDRQYILELDIKRARLNAELIKLADLQEKLHKQIAERNKRMQDEAE